MAQNHHFRLRFNRSPTDTLQSEETEFPLPTLETSHQLVLKAGESNKSIKDSSWIVLRGSGWASPEEAEKFGKFYTDTLLRTFVRLSLGADYGSRAGKSFFTQAGLKHFSEQIGQLLLNDTHGLMVYEQPTNQNVRFAAIKGNIVRGVSPDQFLSLFNAVLVRPREMTARERAAFELFNAALFQTSVDARFLLLMISMEALLIQKKRSHKVSSLVDRLIKEIDASDEIDEKDLGVLKQGIGQLKRQSIREAGKQLVIDLLAERIYDGVSPTEIFNRCYNLRGRLVHGNQPFPSREEVNIESPRLQRMVSDLLSFDLLDIGPSA